MYPYRLAHGRLTPFEPPVKQKHSMRQRPANQITANCGTNADNRLPRAALQREHPTIAERSGATSRHSAAAPRAGERRLSGVPSAHDPHKHRAQRPVGCARDAPPRRHDQAGSGRSRPAPTRSGVDESRGSAGHAGQRLGGRSGCTTKRLAEPAERVILVDSSAWIEFQGATVSPPTNAYGQP